MKCKFTVLVCAMALFATSAVNAQSSIFNLIQIKSVSVSISSERDIVRGLSGDQFMSRIKGNANFSYPGMGFNDQDVESMQCENPNYRVNIGFAPATWTKGMFTIGINSIIDRIEAVSYRDNNAYLDMHTWSDELGLELKYSHKMTLGPLGLTGAVGSNVGFAFGNEMQVEGQNITTTGFDDVIPQFFPSFEDSYKLRNDVYTRFFFELMPSVTIARRFELGFLFRKGFGTRSTIGAEATNGLTHDAVGMSFSWLLHNR